MASSEVRDVLDKSNVTALGRYFKRVTRADFSLVCLLRFITGQCGYDYDEDLRPRLRSWIEHGPVPITPAIIDDSPVSLHDLATILHTRDKTKEDVDRLIQFCVFYVSYYLSTTEFADQETATDE